MNLSTGIIGLPNVGKSTLFNAITNSSVEAANYPFATIEPNIGIVNLPDDRLEKLATLVKPEKIIYSLVKFVDIAGLVKGASKGEGLGNKFLQNIREVDAIIHVVRCFEDSTITHVHDNINPIRDIEIINSELIISDLEILQNRINKIKKTALATNDKDLMFEYHTLDKIMQSLADANMINMLDLSKEEKKVFAHMNLITAKPFIFVANIDENDITNPINNQHFKVLINYANLHNIEVIPISAKIECEISRIDQDDRMVFMQDIGISEPGLYKIIRGAFKMLGLSTFFTVGKKEVRSWIFKTGSFAPDCASVIHTDFKKGFIKVEIIKYDDFLRYGNELSIKEVGKIYIEGKTYVVNDGDICNFKFNV